MTNSNVFSGGYIHGETRINEGELRCKELLEYLNKMGVEKKVWLSEDATAITPKLTYDSKANQIVGLLLPLNRDGLPHTSR